jgi:very-short-patch-repair endonuclease
MKQPTPTTKIKIKPPKKKVKEEKRLSYGTSKLEIYFAENFLDKLGVKYEYQKQFKSINRVFDFWLPECNILLEIDGDFYHFNTEVITKEPSRMQKKNMRVDKIKDKWALLNNIILIRVWENDIHKNPVKVMEMLEKRIGYSTEKQILKEKKKSGEFFNKKI